LAIICDWLNYLSKALIGCNQNFNESQNKIARTWRLPIGAERRGAESTSWNSTPRRLGTCRWWWPIVHSTFPSSRSSQMMSNHRSPGLKISFSHAECLRAAPLINGGCQKIYRRFYFGIERYAPVYISFTSRHRVRLISIINQSLEDVKQTSEGCRYRGLRLMQTIRESRLQ